MRPDRSRTVRRDFYRSPSSAHNATPVICASSNSAIAGTAAVLLIGRLVKATLVTKFDWPGRGPTHTCVHAPVNPVDNHLGLSEIGPVELTGRVRPCPELEHHRGERQPGDRAPCRRPAASS